MSDDQQIRDDVVKAMTQMRKFLRTDAEIEARLREQQAERRLKTNRALMAAGFPKRCVEVRGFEGERWNAAFDRVRASLGKGSVWVLAGIRGSGKTTLGAALARAVLEEAKTARFVELPELIDRMRVSATETLALFGRTDFLLIDEVWSSAKPTAFQSDSLAAIVRRRFDNERDTVMTSNGQVKATLARLGPTVTSRMAIGGVIACNWPSFRAGLEGVPND